MTTPRKSPAKSVAAKKAAVRKVVAKKNSAAKPAAMKPEIKKTAAAKPAYYGGAVPGHIKSSGGILVPSVNKTLSKNKTPEGVVPVSKIEQGLMDALSSVNNVLTKTISKVADGLNEALEVDTIELSLSFDAEGKFMGIGVGGAASVKVCLRPVTRG